jgi:beta-lactamase superfamily II metal-dependent hydrolase
MVIDGGVSSSTNNAVVGLLQAKGITTLDVVDLTHPHFDQYANLIPVFNQFIVDQFW